MVDGGLLPQVQQVLEFRVGKSKDIHSIVYSAESKHGQARGESTSVWSMAACCCLSRRAAFPLGCGMGPLHASRRPQRPERPTEATGSPCEAKQ